MSIPPRRVAFVTFGCRLNRAEALADEARARAAGWTVVAPEEPSDLVVVRACSVTARAQRDTEKAICRLRARTGVRVAVVGCLPGAAREVDFGADASATSAAAVAAALDVSRAHLKVQDGCGGKCAFCIVPAFRGPPRSVPFDEVRTRAREFLAAGYRELVVTGCNLALWRDGSRTLADLVHALADLRADDGSPHRVRLGSLEPGLVGKTLVDAVAAHPNVCRFLHLSVQSLSARVLAGMHRPYAPDAVHDFCEDARSRLGTVALGADLIAGFPGETAADHAATLRAVLALSFANLHVFPYSERPGTPAATMAGALPRAVRLARAKELEGAGRASRAGFAAAFLERDVQVCVEKDGHGWTGEYLRCALSGPRLPRRALVTCRVRHVAGDVLHATI